MIGVRPGINCVSHYFDLALVRIHDLLNRVPVFLLIQPTHRTDPKSRKQKDDIDWEFHILTTSRILAG